MLGIKPTPFELTICNLPVSRIYQIKPFSIVGVDYRQPYLINIGKMRGTKTHKASMCPFEYSPVRAKYTSTLRRI